MSSKIVRAAARIASRFTLGIGAAGVVGAIVKSGVREDFMRRLDPGLMA